MQSIKLVLTEDTPLQTRRARSIDPLLRSSIRAACEAVPEIAACYLLDARRPDTKDETMLLIFLQVDGEPESMDRVAEAFWAVLPDIPDRRGRMYVRSATDLPARYAGSEFYKR